MKVKDISAKYGIDVADLVAFGVRHPGTVQQGFTDLYVDDANLPEVAEQCKVELVTIKKEEQEKRKKEREEEQEKRKKEREKEVYEQEKSQALASILITSGFNFDGYKIVKYSGYISGDDATEIPRGGIFGGNNGKNLTDALVKIRIQALKELKEAAYDLGCNAVIGVDFDYITLEPETATLVGGTMYEPYVICVTANGNAVIIEKN